MVTRPRDDAGRAAAPSPRRRSLLLLLALAGSGRILGGDARVTEASASSPPVRRPPPGAPPTLAPPVAAPPAARGPGQWGEPSSWANGRVPGPGDVARIDRAVILTGAAQVAGVEIGPAGSLTFAPSSASTLASSGNVVVRGRLVLRPAAPAIVHRLTFVDVDERRFRGGHTTAPQDSDVGLWITGAGVLDMAGSPKVPWTRTVGEARRGQTQIVVERVDGWLPGDRIAITPTTPPSVDDGRFHQGVDHALTYDDAVITSITGKVVRLQTALQHDHPVVGVTDWNGRQVRYGAEVLNLTRNVVVEGQPEGRAHVQVLHATRPQQLRHAEIRFMGPRKGSGKKTSTIEGRYGLHFHMCGDASRGSLVEGVVVHSGGAQGFVPHDSHGITLRECVAHDVMAGGFWWDLPERRGSYQPQSSDAVWERCVASKITAAVGGDEGYRMAGFSLSDGEDGSNSCIDCVAVGVTRDRATMNTSTPSGFHWTERGRAMWTFRGCLAHNNGGSGSFSWQNDEKVHVIERFTTYHNARYGIEHGAYSNYWQYRDCALHGDRMAGVGVHAVTRRTKSTASDAPLHTYERLSIDGAGIATFGFTGEGHRFPAPDGVPVVLRNSRIRGARVAAFHMPAVTNREEYLIVDCHLSGREFLLDDGMARTSFAEVVNLNGGASRFLLHPRSHAKGALEARWNARRA